MKTLNGYVENSNMILDSDISSLNGKKFLITFYDEGENPYEIKKPISDKVNKKLNEFVRQTVDSYGSHVKRIVLFGSYARGDYRFDSDVDVIVLTDSSMDEEKGYDEQLSDIAFDVSYEYDTGEAEDEYIVINPLMYSENYFNKWGTGKDPFFEKILREGICLYER